MLNSFRSSRSNIFVWILLGLLIIGLTGFGLGGAVSGLSSQNVAYVGDEPVSREDYTRNLGQRVNQLSRQFGTSLSMQQARSFGLDQQVLAEMMTTAAITGESKAQGLSAGDATVRDNLLQTDQFVGPTGEFSQANYEFTLDQIGMSASEYEDRVREGVARGLLQASIVTGMTMPETMAETLLAFTQERRDFTWAVLNRDMVEGTVPEPSEVDLQQIYEADPDAFTAPETRKITYVALQPDGLARDMTFTDEKITEVYEDRLDDYQTPERRILDRIVYRDQAAAEAAKARVDAGEVTFDDLATERGLSAEEIDRGEVRADDLDSGASDDLFGADGPGVYGPFQSALGPALFRINAILPAEERSLDDVREEIRAELARDEAEAQISDAIEGIEDLLAAGATLEEVAAETDMVLGTLDLTEEDPGEGLSADPSLREQAQATEEGDESDLFDLIDGGIAAVRIDEIAPPALRPMDEVRDQLVETWRTTEARKLLQDRADALITRLQDGTEGYSFDRLMRLQGTDPQLVQAALRTTIPEGMAAEAVEAAFAMDPGETESIAAGDQVFIVTLTNVLPFDATDERAREMIENASLSLGAQAAEDLYTAFSMIVQGSASISVNQTLIDQTLQQYP